MLLYFTPVNLPYFEIIYIHMPTLTCICTGPCTCHLKPIWPSLRGDDLQLTSPKHYPTCTCNTSNYIVNFHSLNRLHLLWVMSFTLMKLALLCLSYVILGMPSPTLTTYVTIYWNMLPLTLTCKPIPTLSPHTLPTHPIPSHISCSFHISSSFCSAGSGSPRVN